MNPVECRLHIMALNLDSIYSIQRRSNLFDFLIEHRPDILLVSETKLRPENFPNFPGYIFVRNDRKKSGGRLAGGTGILIKSHFKFSQVLIPAILKLELVESTIIKLSLPNNINFYIISCYAAPRDSQTFEMEFHKMFELLHLNDLRNHYLLAGDLNARHRNWLNQVNNTRGITLNDWLERNYMQFRGKLNHSVLPTFERGVGNSIIDI